jgi:hypothetical protein
VLKVKKIGGLLRFAPGRLWARKARAPCCCGIRRCAVSRLPYADLGNELRPRPPACTGLACCLGRDGDRQRDGARCDSCGWLGEREGSGLARLSPRALRTSGVRGGPRCAAEGMAVPLAVKDLRPLRGAFGVLDREPLARHRQMGGAG